MSATSTALGEFTAAAKTRFGEANAGANEEGAFVAVGERTVHVRPDPNGNRAVVWVELAKPDHADFNALEHAAMTVTGRSLVEEGFVVTVNRAADLLLLGRSIEAEALGTEDVLDLVSRAAEAAGPAEKALDVASGEPDRPRRNAPVLPDAMFIRI